jgi:hypothetical protein
MSVPTASRIVRLCGGLRLRVEVATKLGDFLRKEIGAGKIGLSQ